MALAVESVFRFVGVRYSLTDSRGPGKIAVFVLVLPAVLLFTRYVARVSALRFIARYATEWRRTLAGFFLMTGATVLVSVAGYVLLAMLGNVEWSPAAWADLRGNLVASVARALLVALMLVMAEEIVFRSFLLRYLRYDDTFPVTVSAVIVSSAIFSVSHLIALVGVWDELGKIQLLVGLFVIGMLLGTVYVATGSVACAMGVHFGLLGFKVALLKTHLLKLVPGWLTGERGDIRMVPLAWLTFLAMALAIVYWRRWLQQRLRVETVVCPDDGGEFQLAPASATPAAAFGISR